MYGGAEDHELTPAMLYYASDVLRNTRRWHGGMNIYVCDAITKAHFHHTVASTCHHIFHINSGFPRSSTAEALCAVTMFNSRSPRQLLKLM